MISYADVPLLQVTPELEEIIEQQIPNKALWEEGVHYWAGQMGLSTPVGWEAPRRPIKPNVLFWPKGASQWAVGHFLIDGEGLEEIREAVYVDGAYTAADLILSETDEDEEDHIITTSMWMLPPRPLFTGGEEKAQKLYLITLVDDRFFWWFRPVDITVSEGVTTWADIYTTIGTALGVTITADTVPAAYLKPGDLLDGTAQVTPLLLDKVAFSVGQRIVRNLDGTINALGYTSSAARMAANQAADALPLTGGLFAFDATEETHDLEALVPANTKVLFPKEEDGNILPESYVVSGTLASLALDEFTGVIGYAGTKVFRTSVVGSFTGGADPVNVAELNSYAEQLTADWYLHALGNQDQKLVGIVPLAPEGLHGAIEWTFRGDEASTRVWRSSLDDMDQEIAPAAGSGGDAPWNIFIDIVVKNVYATNVTVNNLYVIDTSDIPSNCLYTTGAASGTATLNSTTWTDIPGTEETVTVTVEQEVSIVATFDFNGNDTAVASYDGAGSGDDGDLYEGRVVIDGVQVGLLAQFRATHSKDRKTLPIPPIRTLLTTGDKVIKLQARRVSGTGEALVDLNTGWQVRSMCQPGADGGTIYVDNLIVKKYITYVPYLVQPDENKDTYTFERTFVIIKPVDGNYYFSQINLSRTKKDGDILKIVNWSQVYYVIFKVYDASTNPDGNIIPWTEGDFQLGFMEWIELVWDAALGFWRILKPKKDHQPSQQSQLTSDQASLPLKPTAEFIDLCANSGRNIYGIANYWPGRLVYIYNRCEYDILLHHESLSAGTAAERINTQTQGTLTLPEGQGVWLQYNGATSRWRQLTSHVNTQMSITRDASNGYLQLVNDENSPGADMFYATNSSGTKGWYSQTDLTLPPGMLRWVKVSASYSDLADASNNHDIEIYSLPAKGKIHNCHIKTSTAFGGGTIASYSLAVGTTTSPANLVNGYNAFDTVADDHFDLGVQNPEYPQSFASATSIRLSASCSGDTLDNATQGEVDIWFLVSTLP